MIDFMFALGGVLGDTGPSIGVSKSLKQMALSSMSLCLIHYYIVYRTLQTKVYS